VVEPVIEQTTSSGGKVNPLLLIIGIAVLATVIPYIMYYTGFGIPRGTTNEGILIAEPVVITGFTFRDADGQPWNLAEQPPKFRLVIPVRGECGKECRDTLYITRQVRTRLSDESEQVQRLYVQLGGEDDPDFQRFLATEHPELKYLQGDYREWESALGGLPVLSPAFMGEEYYLSHRYGALSMAYNAQHSGNQLLDDLEFLIRTSN
jgi:hypothetical protein